MVYAARFVLACSVLLYFSVPCFLCEQRADPTSWLRQYIGHIDSASLSAQHAFVSSSEEIAALSLADGSLSWRRDADARQSVHLSSSRRLITLEHSTVSSWSTTVGQKLWEAKISPASPSCLCSDSSNLYVFNDGRVQAYTDTGELKWSSEKLQEQILGSGAACAVLNSNSVVRVGAAACTADGTCGYFQASFDLQSGQLQSRSPLVPAESFVSESSAADLSTLGALTENSFVILSQDFSTVCVLGDSSEALECEAVSLSPEKIQRAKLDAAPSTVLLTVYLTDQSRKYYNVMPTQTPMYKALDEKFSAVSESFLQGSSNVRAATHSVGAGDSVLHISTFDADSLEPLSGVLSVPGYPAKHTNTVAQPIAIWGLSDSEAPAGSMFMVQAEDSSLMSVNAPQLNFSWQRDEALASVAHLTLVDAPCNEAETDASVPAPVYDAHKQQDCSQVKAKPHKRSSCATSSWGLQKLIIAATQNGLVYAINSENAKKMWSTSSARPTWDLTWLSDFRLPHTSRSQVALVRTSSDETIVEFLDAAQGTLVHSQMLSESCTHVHVSWSKATHSSALILATLTAPFKQTAAVHVVPSSSCHQGDFTFWAADSKSGAVAGYAPASQGGNQIEQTWEVSVPGSLLAITPVQNAENPQQHVKVYNDRSMRLRYLSPSMIILVSRQPSGAGSGDDPVCWTVLETVAGRILHTHCQHSVQEPISAVFYDHTSLMMFTDKKSLRTIAVALEVYDRSRPQFQVFRDLVDLMTKPSQVWNTSAHIPQAIEVISEAFVLGTGVTAAHPTSSRFGVAPRCILMASATDQVYCLDTKFSDVRQFKTPSTGKQAVPAAAGMRVVPRQALKSVSENRFVRGVSNVLTVPTLLESTIHAVSWGKDLHYALLQPSDGFDTIGADFSHYLLGIALLVAFILCVSLQTFVMQLKVTQKWQ